MGNLVSSREPLGSPPMPGPVQQITGDILQSLAASASSTREFAGPLPGQERIFAAIGPQDGVNYIAMERQSLLLLHLWARMLFPGHVLYFWTVNPMASGVYSVKNRRIYYAIARLDTVQRYADSVFDRKGPEPGQPFNKRRQAVTRQHTLNQGRHDEPEESYYHAFLKGGWIQLQTFTVDTARHLLESDVNCSVGLRLHFSGYKDDTLKEPIPVPNAGKKAWIPRFVTTMGIKTKHGHETLGHMGKERSPMRTPHMVTVYDDSGRIRYNGLG